MASLERLQLDGNRITEIDDKAIAGWTKMKSLNVSRNRLTSIPCSIGSLKALEKFVCNSNNIVALPSTIGQAKSLVQLQFGSNQIKEVPPSIFMLANLKELNMRKNLLTELPAAARGVAKLRIDGDVTIAKAAPPPAPALAETYGVDFSTIVVTPQLVRPWIPKRIRETDVMTPSKVAASPGFKRGRRADDKSEMVLQGLTGIAKQRKGHTDSSSNGGGSALSDPKESIEDTLGGDALPKKARPWNDSLLTSNPNLNLKSMFGEEVGKVNGTHVWCIDQFVPTALPKNEVGTFAENDCYMILNSAELRSATYQAMDHSIYFWIGKNASLDKKASVAICTMYLKSFVGCRGVAKREDQGEETPEFLALFADLRFNIKVGGTESGFYQVIEEEHINRLYLLDGTPLRCTSIAPARSCLSPGHIYILDAVDSLYLWRGADASQALFQRARLFAAKMQQTLVQPGSLDIELWLWRARSWKPIVELNQGSEPASFFECIPATDIPFSIPEHGPKLYEVVLGTKFIELPQIPKAREQYYRFSKTSLKEAGVYILDNGADMYLWKGRDSTRLLKAAASRLVTELEKMCNRPNHLVLEDITEGHEPLAFKNLFHDWHDVLAVDHRSKDEIAVEKCVQERLGNGEASPFATMTVDANELFLPAPALMSNGDAQKLEERCERIADDSEFTAYVYQDKNFKMVRSQVGRFRSSDCYVFLVKEWQDVECDNGGGSGDEDTETQGVDDQQELRSVTAYFWQGRDAGMMGWLTFVHSFKQQIEPLIFKKYKQKLEIVKEFQQRESLAFMALFRRMMTIYTGPVPEVGVPRHPQLFQLHTWRPRTFTRCIEVPRVTSNLNSHSIFILRVPNNAEGAVADGVDSGEGGVGADADADADTSRGTVYVWVGAHVLQEDTTLAEDIASERIGTGCAVKVIFDGKEPDDFYAHVEGSRTARAPGAGSTGARLFLGSCTGSASGGSVFTVSERKPQFAQDDLNDHGAAIVHAGSKVFVWRGKCSSDVVFKMTMAAAREYVRRQKRLGPCGACVLVHEGTEPAAFTSIFHGWGRYICSSLDLGREVPMLGHILDPLPPRKPIQHRHENSPFLFFRPTPKLKLSF